ncbi:hypothetical protein BJY52DRAFT_1374441 [Lactarius psammicola]|nr:hypothetical protein BJY52DRAFT_1374441 [Lactarius psammicola]
MLPISSTVAGPSCFGEGEGIPSLPRWSVEELTSWFSSEIHFSLSTNNVRAPIVVPTQDGNSNCPEPAHANNHQDHPEGITALATAVIPFAGRAVPTMVVLSLVPLQLGADQYAPFLDQGGEPGPFSPSHMSEPSQPSIDFPLAAGDIMIDPRYLGCALSPSGFPVAPRNSIPRPEVRYDYQPSSHGDTTQEPIPDSTPAEVTTSPRVAVYPLPFNQIPGPYSGYLVPGHPSSPTLENSSAVPLVSPAYQNEGNGPSTPRQLLGQIFQDTPTLSPTAEPIRGVEVDQHPSRHQCTMCDAKYARFSGLNRHYKDMHLPWIACGFCGLKFGAQILIHKASGGTSS